MDLESFSIFGLIPLLRRDYAAFSKYPESFYLMD